MKFGIVIRHDGRNIRLRVERIPVSAQLEKFEITARNKSLTIQSNRPLLRAKGLKVRKPNYKLIAGLMRNWSLLQLIFDTLHNAVERIEEEAR